MKMSLLIVDYFGEDENKFLVLEDAIAKKYDGIVFNAFALKRASEEEYHKRLEELDELLSDGDFMAANKFSGSQEIYAIYSCGFFP